MKSRCSGIFWKWQIEDDQDVLGMPIKSYGLLVYGRIVTALNPNMNFPLLDLTFRDSDFRTRDLDSGLSMKTFYTSALLVSFVWNSSNPMIMIITFCIKDYIQTITAKFLWAAQTWSFRELRESLGNSMEWWWKGNFMKHLGNFMEQ